MSWLSGTNFSSALSAVTTAVNAAGGSTSLIPSSMASLTGKVSNQVTPLLNVIVANSSNFAVINDVRTKILEVPGLPATVVPLLTSITPTTTPLEMMQIVAAIETAMTTAGV